MQKSLHELSDQQLLDASFDDEGKVFAILFKRHFNRVYAFSRSLLKDTETAEELAMDVMTRLWHKRGEIDAQNGLLPYLFGSVRNAIISHLRKNQILTQPLENIFELPLITNLDADARINVNELQIQYSKMLTGLPEQRRKIFILSREEDLSYAEIAERLGLSINTVRNQMSSALQYFRKQLNDYDETIFAFLIFIMMEV